MPVYTRIIAAFLAVYALAVPVSANEAIILKQDDAPIRIDWYKANHKSTGRAGVISHRVSVTALTENSVQAFALGFHVFDAFDRNMDKPFFGYHMERLAAGAEQSAVWEQNARDSFTFTRYGTGVVYVAIARLFDGTIWKADEVDIQLQLEDLEFELNQFE